MDLSDYTMHSQKAGPFSVARLKMDLPFHNRLAYSRVHRIRTLSASPLGASFVNVLCAHSEVPALFL